MVRRYPARVHWVSILLACRAKWWVALYRAPVRVPAASASDRTYLTIYRCLTKPGLEATRSAHLCAAYGGTRARVHLHLRHGDVILETVGESFVEPSNARILSSRKNYCETTPVPPLPAPPPPPPRPPPPPPSLPLSLSLSLSL